jgi:hypothetical protein
MSILEDGSHIGLNGPAVPRRVEKRLGRLLAEEYRIYRAERVADPVVQAAQATVRQIKPR